MVNLNNIINIPNIYTNVFNANRDVKIINEVYNKSGSNYRIVTDNIQYIFSEAYVLSFPASYSDLIYHNFVMENNIRSDFIYYLSSNIITITPVDLLFLNNNKMYINNALSQLLPCGWWCKGSCNLYEYNYGQLTPQYNYGSLQDATGLFVVKLICLTLKNEYDERLFGQLTNMMRYLILMQYNNGGIPEYYPLQNGYFLNICFNDGAFLNYLKILAYILDNITHLLDAITLQKLIDAQSKAFNILKQLQVRVNNIPTIWAMQYNPVTLLPTAARTFEPACLGSLESSQVLIYLKEINFTYNNIYDIELYQSYNYGVDWFIKNAINNIIQFNQYDGSGKCISIHTDYTDSTASRLWPRMTNIETQTPIYVDRQGIQYTDLNLLDEERKIGYTWLGNFGEYVIGNT